MSVGGADLLSLWNQRLKVSQQFVDPRTQRPIPEATTR